MQTLTFMFIVSKKIATLKFFLHTDGHLAGQPNADHYIESHFSCVSKTENHHSHQSLQMLKTRHGREAMTSVDGGPPDIQTESTGVCVQLLCSAN